jgi:hypothetical protein
LDWPAFGTRGRIEMTDSPERVILVDQNDQEIGVAEKIDAHRRGLLQRAEPAGATRRTPLISG